MTLRHTTVANTGTIKHMLSTFNDLDKSLRKVIIKKEPEFVHFLETLNAAKERKSKRRIKKFIDLRTAVVNNELTDEQIQKLIEYFGTQDSSGTMEQGMGKK